MSAVAENLRDSPQAVGRDLRVRVRRSQLWSIAGFCLFEVAFYFAYRYGMSFSHACASPFWFPDSILLCALLLNRRARWWIFVLAPLPIRLFVAVPADVPSWFLLATFVIDSAKGLFAATALRRFIRNPLHLETVREFAVYCLFAVLLIPAVSAFAGAGARHFLGHDYWSSWEQWFMGNALAHLVVTPAILYWFFAFPWTMRMMEKKRCIEAALLAAGLILTGYMAFNSEAVPIGVAEARFYAPVPFLFWAAVRFGMVGASGAIMMIAFLAVQAALADRGLFAGQSPGDTALALQHFLLLRAAPLYLVAILVEQRKKAEAEAQRQRMELAHVSRISTMGQLASALVHELNQPLSAMLWNIASAELILQQNRPDYEELRAILSDIRGDGRRAGAVIDRMRSLLKRHHLEFEALSVKQLFDQVVVLLRSEMLARRVTVQVNSLSDLPAVRGDRVHLQQVLLNLLINGADAMNDLPAGHRRLLVQARLADTQTVEVTVSDAGYGIPEDKLTQVFEPFFTTRADGMGMGLAISKTIVEAHGGRVWAENNVEGGATFRFTLKTAEHRGGNECQGGGPDPVAGRGNA